MDFGIVSNCWRAQLEAGASLEDLIAEAVRRGYNYVELRQGCLGSYERGSDPGPDAEALARLAGRFTEIGFNLALALPFFGSAVTPAHPLFQAGLDSSYAMAAGRARNAHVRLVDTETPPESLAGATPEAIAERL